MASQTLTSAELAEQKQHMNDAFDALIGASKILLQSKMPGFTEVNTAIVILTAYAEQHGFDARTEYEKGRKGN